MIKPIKLYDRADGVKGHYCVGREVTDGTGSYTELWNDKAERWCSAGTVYKRKKDAEDKKRWLQVTKFMFA